MSDPTSDERGVVGVVASPWQVVAAPRASSVSFRLPSLLAAQIANGPLSQVAGAPSPSIQQHHHEKDRCFALGPSFAAGWELCCCLGR